MKIQRGALVRAALTAVLAPSPQLVARPALALNEQAMGATCAGFGCNDYRGQTFNGLTNAPTNSMPYTDFLSAIKEKRVVGVDFKGPNGDEAYALIKEPAEGGKSCKSYDPDGAVIEGLCRLRMGEGWPVEDSAGWSSPTWVVRILTNEDIPYSFSYDTKVKPKRRTSFAAGKYEPPITSKFALREMTEAKGQ